MIDQRILHSKYGSGIVKKTRYNGFELLVQFATGSHRWVRADEIMIETPHVPQQPLVKPLSLPHRHRPRRMLESFRLGIVPDDCVDEFTFGRETETHELKSWLSNPHENALALIGAYGSGKTHLLNYARSYAMQEGYAVAFVEMDAIETPFSRPKRVYSQLVRSLRYRPEPKASKKDFRWLIRKALNDKLFQDHFYFEHLRGETRDDVLWNWIEARESTSKPYSPDTRYIGYPGLYDNGTSANIYCYLLSSIAWACTQPAIGLKGLLLVFDEAETLHARSTVTAADRSYNFLHALIATVRGDADLLEPPYKNNRFVHATHANAVPFLYRQPSGLKVLFAFTSDDGFYRSNELDSLRRLYLDALDIDGLHAIFEAISKLYTTTYGVTINDEQIDAIREQVIYQEGPTRLAVKSFVEALDILRFHPHDDPFEVLV